MSSSTDRIVRVRLICESPPASSRAGVAVEFGLQDKAGRLDAGSALPDGSRVFESEARVVTLPDGERRLRGPIVHGPPSAPFLYLSCRPAGVADAPWIFRLKIPLAGVAERSGANGDAGDGLTVEGRVRATGGGSVPLIGGGWVERYSG